MILREIMLFLKLIKVFLTKEKSFSTIKWLEINESYKRFYDEYQVPKLIWIYWDSFERPHLVDLCIQRIKQKCSDFEVVVLDKDTVSTYIDLPHLNDQLPKALIADLIRLKLLDKYGGVWMDASIFLNENLDWILSRLNGQEAFLFYSDECTINLNNPISENWLIISPRGSLFINQWLSEYEKCITSLNPVDYYNHIKDDKGLMQNLTRPDYLLCYISAIVVLNKNKYNIIYASSATVGHFYNYKYKFDGSPIAVDLLLKSKDKIFIPKLIKFTSGTRNVIEKFIVKGLYTKNSLIGRYLKSLEFDSHQK